jgi:hypothetical protein
MKSSLLLSAVCVVLQQSRVVRGDLQENYAKSSLLKTTQRTWMRFKLEKLRELYILFLGVSTLLSGLRFILLRAKK